MAILGQWNWKNVFTSQHHNCLNVLFQSSCYLSYPFPTHISGIIISSTLNVLLYGMAYPEFYVCMYKPLLDLLVVRYVV